jgi:hypothetical protein
MLVPLLLMRALRTRADMRNALRFLMAAQHDDSAEQLEAATAARYRLVGGQWQRMPAEQAQRATAAAAASVSGGT